MNQYSNILMGWGQLNNINSINNIGINFSDIFNTLGANLIADPYSRVIIEDDIDINNDISNSYCMVDYIEEDKLNTYNNTNIHSFNNLNVVFNVNIYIEEILKSYNYNNDKIWDQFVLDLPRTNVYVNKDQIISVEQFKQLLNVYLHNEYQLTNLALICNQSSYAFPYIYLYNLHKNIIDNPDNPCILTCLNSSRNIVFNMNNPTNKKVTLEADFAIKVLENQSVFKKINILLTLYLNNNCNSNSTFNNFGDIDVIYSIA
jgi:hypothetical protein